MVAIINTGFFTQQDLPSNTRSSDGSNQMEQCQITYFGQPIRLAEYATRFTTGKSTHVVLLNDWQIKNNTSSKLRDASLDFDANPNELLLETRPNQSRLSYAKLCNILALHKHFEIARKKSKRNVFQIPYEIKQTGADMVSYSKFDEVIETEQTMIDLRSVEEKELLAKDQ